MSRIGRMPVTIPAGVEVSIAEPNVVTVKGPKGTLTQTMRPEMIIKVEGNVIHVGRPSEDKLHKSLHGLTRSLIHDMVVGVTDGFKKELEINGVGYKASKEGNKLVMNLGYSHLVTMEEIDGITIDVPAPNKVVINGIDKQKVGQFAANVRGKRPPEPYKGKGIKYATETIRHKEGKAGGKKERMRFLRSATLTSSNFLNSQDSDEGKLRSLHAPLPPARRHVARRVDRQGDIFSETRGRGYAWRLRTRRMRRVPGTVGR